MAQKAATEQIHPTRQTNFQDADLGDFGFRVPNDMALIQDTVQPGLLSKPLYICLHRLIGRHHNVVLAEQGLQQGSLPGSALVLQGMQETLLHEFADLVRPVGDQGRGAHNQGGGWGHAGSVLVHHGRCRQTSNG